MASDPQMITCYRNQLRTAPGDETRSAVFLMWTISHEDITLGDLIDVFKEETEAARG